MQYSHQRRLTGRVDSIDFEERHNVAGEPGFGDAAVQIRRCPHSLDTGEGVHARLLPAGHGRVVVWQGQLPEPLGLEGLRDRVTGKVFVGGEINLDRLIVGTHISIQVG